MLRYSAEGPRRLEHSCYSSGPVFLRLVSLT
uniref:Uncharacterized protein n=1 Tax=Arundo donax TaxID=35708 RepID=A0A0A9GMG2_ARUDO